MTSEFQFTLNGRAERVEGIDPHTTLLSYLRARGLTGSKEGCAEGECGACAVVLVEGAEPGHAGARFTPVNACLVLLPSVAGAEVWTVEGIGRPGALHPVQEALVHEGASQCGYCTPGFAMSLFAEYYRERRVESGHALSGNLCRCTGYRPIRDAAARMGRPAAGDPFAARLARQAPSPASLDYVAAGARFSRPVTLDEALALRAAHPRAQVLAGGTDLIVGVNQDRLRRDHWLSIEAVEELRVCEQRGGEWVIGGGVPLAALEERVGDAVPLFDQLLPLFASPLIRARATLGGNLVTASPVGDAAPVLLALDADVELASLRGRRRIPLWRFFTDYRTSVLAGDELLVSVRVPAAMPTHASFHKVTKRRLDDIASVATAFAVHVDGAIITRARVALGGVAPTPLRVRSAEQALEGRPFDREAVVAMQEALDASLTPIDDHRASAAYRRAVVQRLCERFWREAHA